MAYSTIPRFVAGPCAPAARPWTVFRFTIAMVRITANALTAISNNLCIYSLRYGSWKRGSTAMSRSKNRNRKRSEEHTSELQSRGHLVCRLLLEKKNTHLKHNHHDQ